MKKLLMIGMLGIFPLCADAFENPKILYGKECSINTYDSYEEAGHIGKIGIDSEEVINKLISKLKSSNYRYHNKIMELYYFTDFEFLIEIKQQQGRSSDQRLSLEIWNTGKFGAYKLLFYLEKENTGNFEEVARNMISQIPPCVKAQR